MGAAPQPECVRGAIAAVPAIWDEPAAELLATFGAPWSVRLTGEPDGFLLAHLG